MRLGLSDPTTADTAHGPSRGTVSYPAFEGHSCEHGGVEPIARDRERLLYRSTRALGVTLTLISTLTLAVPGIIDPVSLTAILPLAAVLILSLVRLGETRSLRWLVTGILSGLAILAIPHLPLVAEHSPSLAIALIPLAGGALAAFAFVLTTSVPRLLLLGAAFTATVVLTELISRSDAPLSAVTITVASGWVATSFLGIWLTASIPRAVRRIQSIGRAHRAERLASELEAQRRQGARLLHDTVLASLTLLAHSGVGVAPDVLRQQAAEDARLLRQQRLETTADHDADVHNATTRTIETPETTLESVKHRFDRIGLDVHWHGTGRLDLQPDVLEAFLLALTEALENVRRHANVDEAHVTITDDETTVRAMVTDSGRGFDPADVDPARMGLKDSIMGRLGEVGGKARFFSSLGAGTTVVLEAPK